MTTRKTRQARQTRRSSGRSICRSNGTRAARNAARNAARPRPLRGAKVPRRLRALGGVDPRLLGVGVPYPCDDPRVGTMVPGGRSTPGGRVVACASRGPEGHGYDLFVGGAPLAPRQVAAARAFAEGETRRALRRTERRAERGPRAATPRKRAARHAEVYGPRESFGVGAFEEARALPYGPRESLGTGAFEERRAIARGAMPDSVEIIVGKTTTQLRRKRFDIGARVSGNYVPGMSVTVAEEHGGGSWAVVGHTYDGSKRREINYGGGLSRAAATALAEKVLRAATIERTSGGVMAVLPEPQAPVYEVRHIDRVTNAQAGRSWKGNRAPPGDEWIASSHLTIRRSAAGHMVPSHNGERRFKPWNQSLFKILDAPSTEYSQMRHQDFGGIAIPPNDRVSAQLVGWVDTGRAGTPRVATFLGEDGTAVNANADYVALIERNLGGHARPFVSRGEPLAGVQWFDHRGSMSAALMAIREEGPVAKPPPRANPSRNNRRRS